MILQNLFRLKYCFTLDLIYLNWRGALSFCKIQTYFKHLLLLKDKPTSNTIEFWNFCLRSKNCDWYLSPAPVFAPILHILFELQKSKRIFFSCSLFCTDFAPLVWDPKILIHSFLQLQPSHSLPGSKIRLLSSEIPFWHFW